MDRTPWGRGSLACHPQGVTLPAFSDKFTLMGHSLRTKIMTGVIALLLLFAAALAITLYMVKDSDDEVSGISEYHLPILTRLNSLDVITYEIEVLAQTANERGRIRTAMERCQLTTAFGSTPSGNPRSLRFELPLRSRIREKKQRAV